MNLKTIFSDAHSAVLSRAFNDGNVDNVDYEILKLAAVSGEDATNAMEAYMWNDTQSDTYHPTIQERIAEEHFLPRMKRLAEAGYLIESEEENTPGIYKDFKLNLNTSKKWNTNLNNSSTKTNTPERVNQKSKRPSSSLN